MDKKEIIERLSQMGIITENCYPKTTFPKRGEIHVGLFKREMMDDFYFYNTFDKKIYCFLKPSNIDNYEKDDFRGSIKFLIPLHECSVVWEDKEYVELIDIPYNEMTIRRYACIHLKVPESGVDWLDALIKKSNSAP